MRIVSLLPSSTEIVCKLGLQDYLVGRSHECDYPSGVAKLPALTKPKFNVNTSSANINNSVNTLLQNSLSVYALNESLLSELKPDFILTQSQCEVCAVSMNEVEKAAEALIGSTPIIVNLQPNSLEDIYEDILRASLALGKPKEGKTSIQTIQSQLNAIQIKSAPLQKPTLACIEWLDPIMLAANWVPDLVSIAGGTNVLAKRNEHSHYFKWQAIVEENPEYICIMPCGFDIQRTMQEIELLTKTKEWNMLQAVQNQKVYVTDGNHFFNRPGPRIMESCEILAEILHPSIFDFGHSGKSYIQL